MSFSFNSNLSQFSAPIVKSSTNIYYSDSLLLYFGPNLTPRSAQYWDVYGVGTIINGIVLISKDNGMNLEYRSLFIPILY